MLSPESNQSEQCHKLISASIVSKHLPVLSSAFSTELETKTNSKGLLHSDFSFQNMQPVLVKPLEVGHGSVPPITLCGFY